MKPNIFIPLFTLLSLVGMTQHGFTKSASAPQPKDTKHATIAFNKPFHSRQARTEDRRRWQLASRGLIRQASYMDMEATAYDPGPISCGPYANGYTATGLRAGRGIVAVDPRVIPLGTRVYVEGYGFAVAADIGSAIKGNRIDLGYPTYREALQFGRHPVRVYLLPR